MHVYFVDLRMKMEPMMQDEPPSSTATGNGTNTSPSNGPINTVHRYENDRDKTDLIPSSLWNSVQSKLSHKSNSVTTPDGKFD